MALVWTKTDNPAIQNIGFASNSATFSNANIGTAASDRIVVVNVTTSANGPVTGVTIGGNAATKAVESNPTGNQQASQWYLLVTAGTTANVVVSQSLNFAFVGITVGALTGSASSPASTGALAYGFNGDPQVASSVTIASGGIALVCGGSNAPNATPTWNNGTADYSTISGTSWQIVSGFSTSAGAFASSISGYAFAGFMSAVSNWAPAAAGGGFFARPYYDMPAGSRSRRSYGHSRLHRRHGIWIARKPQLLPSRLRGRG